MIIAIDAMGGDHAPAAVLDGIRMVLPELPQQITLCLYGDEIQLREGLNARQMSEEQIKIVPTTEIIGCEEAPTLAVRKKKDSSLVRAVRAVADGEADCVLSAGSTGALLTGGTLIIKRLEGVKRPALATILPTVQGGSTVLLDCGANTDCKPEYLVQFALMGGAYANRVLGIQKPRIGLLNNGAEAEKGNELTKAAYQLFQNAPFDFAGNCEARDVCSGDFDVVVCDGFDGNMILKGMEGTVSLMMTMMKKSFMSSLRTKIGAKLAMPALRSLKKSLDYTEFGGAPLLGVRSGVIKAHGSSNGKAFRSAILQAVKLVQTDVCGLVQNSIASMPQESEETTRD